MSSRSLGNCLERLIDEVIPGNVPLVLGFHLLRLGHSAVLDRVQCELFQQTKILSSRSQPQEGNVEIVRQRRGTPESGIIRRYHNRIVIREVNGAHVVPAVIHQLQDLVGNRVQLDTDVAFLQLLQHPGMLDGGESVADAFRSEQDGVNL